MARNRVILLVALLAATVAEVRAQDDFGLWVEMNVERQVSKRLDIGGGLEVRRRDNLKEADRLSVEVNGSYKIAKWLKLNGGISLLEDNRYKVSGKLSKYSQYWSTRLRVYAGLTASHSFNRLTLSLRERWQYTYRPKSTENRYWNYTDEDDDIYEGELADRHTFDIKAKNVWRNRLQAKYKLTKTWRPFVNVETNVSHGLEKIRYAAGTEIRITKQHVIDVKYLYQHCPKDDDDEGDRHVLGISYTYKF